ncbi:MAG TPA: preprotein translocase subunit Sec61beta [Candidatus Aenigmarchaeota archaeon]|nr:preprotein translocase subunit Sec61beta [Candidatus Aenigmarchaeota archaeon]
MAREKEKITLPASYGGIMRYFEDFETQVKLKPQQVIILTLLVALFVIFLFLLNPLNIPI